MATEPLQPGVAPANTCPRVPPSPNSLAVAASRRNFVGGLAAAPIALLSAPSLAADRTEWADALAQYRLTTAAYSKASAAYSKAEALYFDCKPAAPVFTIEQEQDLGKFGKHILPTTVHYEELDDPEIEWDNPEQIATFRAQLADYRREAEAASRASGHREAEHAEHVAMRAQSAALERLVSIPAPDLPALAEKLEIILAEYGNDGGTVTPVLADVRRLAGEARHG